MKSALIATQDEETATEPRELSIKIRVSPSEYAEAEILAKEVGLPLSTYCRQALLRRPLVSAIPSVNYDAIGQLKRIGNNINQALVAIYTGKVPPSFRPALLELITLIRKLRAELAGQVAAEYTRDPVVQPANDPDLVEDPDPAENGDP